MATRSHGGRLGHRILIEKNLHNRMHNDRTRMIAVLIREYFMQFMFI